MRFRDALRQIASPRRSMTVVPAAGSPPPPMSPLAVASWMEAHGGHDALMSMAYLACELAKMRPVSMLPVHVYESTENGRVEARGPVAFRLAQLLRTRWNPTLKAPNALQWVMLTKDTVGRAYVRVEWDEFQGVPCPVALWPMTGSVQRMWDDGNRTLHYLYSGDQFTPAGLYEDREVVAFSSPLADIPDTRGRSLAEAAMGAVGLDIDGYEFYSALLNNGTYAPRWVETDRKMSVEEKAEFNASVAQTRGILGSGYVRVLDDGMKLRQSEARIVDLDFLDVCRWNLQTVCRVCGVPPNEVYDNSQLTYSGNVEMSAIQFASKTLMPECKELETAIDCILRSAGVFDTNVKFDINGLLRGQYESRMKGYQIGIFTGFFTPNEVREWEEMPKVPGGDRRMFPTNYYIVGDDGELLPPPKSEGGGAPGAAGDIPSEPEKALATAEAVLHHRMVERVAARAAETGDTPSTRRFARDVLGAWEEFCFRAGIDYDIQSEIEGLMGS